MKRTTLKLALTCMTLAVISGTALAQTAITLVNAGFESPGTVKIKTGFDVSGANDVPGWSNTVTTATSDSGVEGGGHGGFWEAYLQTQDGGAFQISGKQMVTGETYTLVWYAKGGWNGSSGTFSGSGANDPVQQVVFVKASSQSSSFTSVTSLVGRTNGVPGGAGWIQYTLSYVATAGDAGSYIGFFFNARKLPTNGTGSYASFDDFSLSFQPAGSPPVVGNPTATPNPVYALSPVTISDTAVNATSYRWQTNSDLNGGLGGTWVNVGGATNLSFSTTPADVNPGGSDYTIDYQLVASNGTGSTTSSVPVALLVHAASGPQLTLDITPNPATTFTGNGITFSATFIGTTPLTYQWQTDAGQTGTFTNIPGATATTFTIASTTLANGGNYQLRASNVVSVAYSSPSLLTVYQVIYSENFNATNVGLTDINAYGWREDVKDAAARVFTVSGTNRAVYSYDNAGTFAAPVDIEAFYATTATANGTITNLGFPQQAFPSINLQTVNNLQLNVSLYGNFNANLVNSYFAVQMNFGQWYVSTTPMTFASTATPANFNLPFSPTAANWNLLTVTGTGGVVAGSLGTNVPPSIGAAASSDLSGYITGAGLVCVHSGNSTHDFDNFIITGVIPFTALPVINSPPFATSNYTGSAVSLSVSAVSNSVPTGLTYQWQTNASVGSSTWANISNGGQFSGATASSLVISNITTAANHKDYRVIVTDGAGSTTSAPPATLTVIDSKPLLVNDTIVSPNAVHAGNNNTINMSASFTGSQPISYQWQVATDTNGAGAVNVPGATNSTFNLANPTTNNMAYYSLKASNSQSVTPTNSTWTLLTVNPASTSFFTWSPVQGIIGLTDAQIMNGPLGTFFEAEVNGPNAVTVTVGSNNYFFAVDSSAATPPTIGGPGSSTVAFTGTTGNANLDAVLSQENEVNNTPTITLHNLTPGVRYSAQLFAINDNGDPSRIIAYRDPNDTSDVSQAFSVGSDSYVIGTFTANAADVPVQMFLANGHGYFTAVVVRTLPPVVTAQLSGSNLQVTWDVGTLLESTNVAGPYTPTAGSPTSPYVVTPTAPQMFYRVSNP